MMISRGRVALPARKGCISWRTAQTKLHHRDAKDTEENPLCPTALLDQAPRTCRAINSFAHAWSSGRRGGSQGRE